MIKTAARNIQITSPIRPKPFAVRLIALPKTSSFAQEIFDKYSSVVETDVTAAPFVFLDMFGKELAQEREQYYRMMLTLRLMIAHKLVVSGKLGDPTVSGAYMSSVRVLISETLNYFRNSSNIIYNKLTDARRIVEASGAEIASGVLAAPEDDETLTSGTLIYSFSEGEERYYRELLEKTVSETIFENIGSYPAETQSLILRRYDHIAEKTDNVPAAVSERPAPVNDNGNEPADRSGNDTGSAENVVRVLPESHDEMGTPVLTHISRTRETENEAIPSSEHDARTTTVNVREIASQRKENALSGVTAADGGKYIPLMNTMMSGGARYFAAITLKNIHRRTIPASVIRPFMETVRRKKTRETFPLVAKALDILTAPDKANSQERAVYEYAVSAVYQRRRMPEQPETAEVMLSRLERKERTDVLVLALNRLREISGKVSGKTIKYPDGKNIKRELSSSESALVWAIVRDESGALLGELSGSVKNNVIINRLEKLYSAHAPDGDKGHTAVTANIERVLSSKEYFRTGAAASVYFPRGRDTANTYERFSLISMLMSSGKEGTAAAMAVLPGVINTEKTVWSELPVIPPSMTLRKEVRDSEKTFYTGFFEQLVSRNITLSEMSSISRELLKARPSAAVITKRVESILRTAEKSAPADQRQRTSDITITRRAVKNAAEKNLPAFNGAIPAESVRMIAETLLRRDDSRAKTVGGTLVKLLAGRTAQSAAGETIPTFSGVLPAESVRMITETLMHRDIVGTKADSVTLMKLLDGRTAKSAASENLPVIGGVLPAENVRVIAETLIHNDDIGAGSVSRTLMKLLTGGTAHSAMENMTSVTAPVQTFRTGADAKGVIRTVTKLIGQLSVTGKKTISADGEIPDPGVLYEIMTQRPAGYIGGTFRMPSARSLRTLARTLSVPANVSAGNTGDAVPAYGAAERTVPALITQEDPTADTVTLNYRSTAPAVQQQTQSSGGRLPTTEELVEQFGNLIEGADPTKPTASVRMIDGEMLGGNSGLEETMEKLRQTTEKTENNTKLIEEITRKQKEIEKSLRRSSDIGSISEEVIKQLRMQLRFDSSRFMS